MASYLDASGTHGAASPTVVLGGFVATEASWAAYEKDLQNLLDMFGVDVFHAKKFRKRAGPFRGWSQLQKKGDMATHPCNVDINGPGAAADSHPPKGHDRILVSIEQQKFAADRIDTPLAGVPESKEKLGFLIHDRRSACLFGACDRAECDRVAQDCRPCRAWHCSHLYLK
jgi:hypothetical protein